jgi:glycosyltransferase involved in cell wall biosynthesis
MLAMVNDKSPITIPQEYKDVYTIGTDGPWTNQDLIKEKNLNGYFLSKLTGGKHYFPFGANGADYPFLKYVSDIDFPLINSENFTAQTAKEYIIKNSDKADILIIPFASTVAAQTAEGYRKSRKDGKLVITNDTNRQHINADYQMLPEAVQPFFCSADAVTIASKNLRDMLNADPKNKFPTFLMTHAFSNATGEDLSVSPSDKENVILSVGRLDVMSKNTAALVNAFARASSYIPEWKLVLAGKIAAAFAADLLRTYPHIADKIEFAGELDKASLYAQYKKAKIHVMASVCENQPNVCSEAMVFGCYQILSDSMDGVDELTRGGEFGIVYEQERYIKHPALFKYAYVDGYRGEAEINLANALINAARKLDKSYFEEFIPKSQKLQLTEFDYSGNARKLALLMFT